MVSALPKDVKKVYLLNQDYLFGQSMQRDTKMLLAKQRPDIKVVGDELIPFGKVKDFSPYVTKIKASGAQALITGNWGHDMKLLIKAGMDAGLDIGYYTYLAHLSAARPRSAPTGENRLHSVMEFHENVAPSSQNTEAGGFRQGLPREERIRLLRDQLPSPCSRWSPAAIDKAGSTDALKVAQALEGMHMKDLLGNDTKCARTTTSSSARTTTASSRAA